MRIFGFSLALIGLLFGNSSCIFKTPRPEIHAPGQDPNLKSRTQYHAQLISEMMEVVLLQPIEGESTEEEARQWVSALNSGASVEGIYNGLTHSAQYRRLETRFSKSPPAAIEVFIREMNRIQGALKSPSNFDEESAKPLAMPVDLSTEEQSLKFKTTQSEAPLTQAKSPKNLKPLFAGASLFTLKRVLGEETLKLLRETRSVQDRARWYGQWASRSAESGVDFGLELRNRADEKFHRQWALSVHLDLLVWEVLNRQHRFLNATLSQR